MTPKKLTLLELLDLIDLEDYRGIIEKNELLRLMLEQGVPRVVADARGDIRLTIDRLGEDFSVTQHPTALARESINQVL
ncbi:MAG: hypothetical protein OEY44_02575 [Candidatus Peregrinibacteria bacterium]|nr:hypothetical protein [Candidatus Peregrinibacteria bacterium]